MNCEMNCEHAQNERLIDFKYIIKCQHVSLCTSYISIYICLTRSAYKICAGVIAVCEYDGAITNQRKKSGKRFQRATRKRNFCIDRG